MDVEYNIDAPVIEILEYVSVGSFFAPGMHAQDVWLGIWMIAHREEGNFMYQLPPSTQGVGRGRSRYPLIGRSLVINTTGGQCWPLNRVNHCRYGRRSRRLMRLAARRCPNVGMSWWSYTCNIYHVRLFVRSFKPLFAYAAPLKDVRNQIEAAQHNVQAPLTSYHSRCVLRHYMPRPFSCAAILTFDLQVPHESSCVPNLVTLCYERERNGRAVC